ncbi:MAG: PBS lyase [Cyanobacteria bacterium QS_4_48_99]|nr:MAG: PBS lyase [Cyanobacteria bacterium QS_4_48_99]
MKLSSLETTPNPNCMKLNLDEQIADKPVTLKQGQSPDSVPDSVMKLLQIQGIQEAFLASNFITLIRRGNADWEPILSEAARVLGVAENAEVELLTQSQQTETTSSGEDSKNLGEVEVAVLMFRGIPVQVRVTGEEEQARVSLPEQFNEAMQRAVNATGANYVLERYWEPYTPRNGQPEEVANMVADEVASLIDEAELARLEKAAIEGSQAEAPRNEKTQQADLVAQLSSSDWKVRLKAVQKLEINAESFSAVVAALEDERATIRRWATALLGASEMSEAIDPLSRAVLWDKSAIVRRTAGDALSDLGDTQAMPTMGKALEDPSKLVRWRAARFLYETGDEKAVEALQKAIERESEFDVRLEMNAALERITSGGDRQLPMWMRLSQREG